MEDPLKKQAGALRREEVFLALAEVAGILFEVSKLAGILSVGSKLAGKYFLLS